MCRDKINIELTCLKFQPGARSYRGWRSVLPVCMISGSDSSSSNSQQPAVEREIVSMWSSSVGLRLCQPVPSSFVLYGNFACPQAGLFPSSSWFGGPQLLVWQTLRGYPGRVHELCPAGNSLLPSFEIVWQQWFPSSL